MKIELVFDFILVYIVSRVLTKEVITEWFREYLLKKNLFLLESLFSCPFCMSFWVSSLWYFFLKYYENLDLPIFYFVPFCMLFVAVLDTILKEKIK